MNVKAETVKEALDGRWEGIFSKYLQHGGKPRSQGWHDTYCPFHETDGAKHNPSFSWNLNGAWVCQAGCGKGDGIEFIQRAENVDFLAALEILANIAGLDVRNEVSATSALAETPQAIKPKIVAIYPYHDQTGQVLYEAVREEPKGFKFRQPKGKGYKYNLNGVHRVLYKLPDVLQAIEKGITVWLVEGEKDVETLTKLGFTATTNPMGAGKWNENFTEALKRANVVIIPDNDQEGIKHSKTVARDLQRVANSVKVLELPSLSSDPLPQKFDVTDWLKAGGSVETLVKQAEELPQWMDKDLFKGGKTAKEILEMDIPDPVWIIPNMIQQGLTILAGSPKLGKSWLALSIAVAVSSGGYALGAIKVDQAGVLYLALEDSDRRLQNRLNSLGATPRENLTFFTEWERGIEGANKLDSYLMANKSIKLVVVDVLARMKALQGQGRPSVYDADYQDMEPFQRLANKHDVAVLLIHHTRKAGGEDFLDSIGGSYGISGSVDTAIVLRRSRGETDAKLCITGRDVDENEYALEKDIHAGGWKLLGDAREYDISKERKAILKVMQEVEEPIKLKDIADMLGKTSNAIYYHVAKMVDEGLAKKAGYSKYELVKRNTSKEKEKVVSLFKGNF
jgi:hypothetical protein